MSAEKISYELKRFAGIQRDYKPEEVERLRGSIKIEYSMCKQQSQKLWRLLNTEPYVNTLGSLSGNQAVQHAKAGLKAIYLSGWQVAADANSAGEMYPDQSLYPYDSAPKLVEAILSETTRIVRMEHGVIIVQTKHGFVCANAGIDESNVDGNYVTLLPKDPDNSAKLIQDEIRIKTGKNT